MKPFINQTTLAVKPYVNQNALTNYFNIETLHEPNYVNSETLHELNYVNNETPHESNYIKSHSKNIFSLCFFFFFENSSNIPFFSFQIFLYSFSSSSLSFVPSYSSDRSIFSNYTGLWLPSLILHGKWTHYINLPRSQTPAFVFLTRVLFNMSCTGGWILWRWHCFPLAYVIWPFIPSCNVASFSFSIALSIQSLFSKMLPAYDFFPARNNCPFENIL